MTTANKATHPVEVVIQVLAAARKAAPDDIEPTPQNLKAGIDIIMRQQGALEAARVANDLLAEELKSLLWVPASGVDFVEGLLALGEHPHELLENICIYLSLYYQELDGIIQHCWELLDRRDTHADAEVVHVLSTALEDIKKED